MNFRILLFAAVCAAMTLPSCVSKKKFTALEAEQQQTQMSLEEAMARIKELQEQSDADRQRLTSTLQNKEAELAREKTRADALQDQVSTLKSTTEGLLKQMEATQMTSAAEAKSIQNSLEKINKQSAQIERLNDIIRVKDSTNVALVYNLKKSLDDINDEDIEVEVKGTKVFVSISDKLLFNSGSATINAKASDVLSKVASVVKDNQNLEVPVEGHTDNVPISTANFADNWELSTARATAVVKALSTKYGVQPGRLAAAGRGEYMPKASNDTAEGRAMNRRTEIILTPKLDQFFKLLEAPDEVPAR